RLGEGAAAAVGGELVNAGRGRDTSSGQLAADIARLMGADADISEDPRRLRPKDSEVLRLCCDAARLRERTGWQPRYTREQGLEQTIEWFQRPGNLARYNPDEYSQ